MTEGLKERKLERRRIWRSLHLEECREKDRQRYIANRKEKLERMRNYYASHAKERRMAIMEYRKKHPDKPREANRRYYVLNSERQKKAVKKNRMLKSTKYKVYMREYQRIRMKNPVNRMVNALRGRLGQLIRGYKSKSTMELVGCSGEFLMDYLSAQFRHGMTRENYGSVWHIDHIKSLASFGKGIIDPDIQREAFHYTNLQPLLGIENCSKGARCGKTGNTWGN